jgi:hypothetical protein
VNAAAPAADLTQHVAAIWLVRAEREYSTACRLDDRAMDAQSVVKGLAAYMLHEATAGGLGHDLALQAFGAWLWAREEFRWTGERRKEARAELDRARRACLDVGIDPDDLGELGGAP